MNRRKILVFIDWYLPGFKAGGPIRSCANMVAHLSREYDFFIVTRDTDYMDSTSYPDVKKDAWNKLDDGSQVYYISKENVGKNTFQKIISFVNPDIIYLNGIFSYRFTILPLKLADKKKIKTIVAVRGMLAPGALAIKAMKKKIFLSYAKLTGLYEEVIFQASSEMEREQTQRLFPSARILVAPNLPRKGETGISERIAKNSGEVRLLNIGRIAPEKNLLFALEILKQVKVNVVFDFYGPVYDNAYWKKCKNEIRKLPSNVKANYRGIAEGKFLSSLLVGYHFLFLPSRGENFGHIILESLSAGLPVIISSNTPWKALISKNGGWDISLDDSQGFVEAIEKCGVIGEDEYKILSAGARQIAEVYVKDEEKINATRQLFS